MANLMDPLLDALAGMGAQFQAVPRHFRALWARPQSLLAVPDADVTGVSREEWRATGLEPRFLLEGPLPEGLVEVGLRGRSSTLRAVALVLDDETPRSPQLLLGTLGPAESMLTRNVVAGANLTLRLRLTPSPGTFTISDVWVRPVSPLEIARDVVQGGEITRGDLRRPSALRARWVAARHRRLWPEGDPQAAAFAAWRAFNELAPEEVEILREQGRALKGPKISIVVPVFNPDADSLHRCIQSVKEQYYTNWELCLADDASTEPWVRSTLSQCSAQDPRVRVVFREINGHISAASNSALELATGEFVALLDQDDELTPDALLQVALAIHRQPDLDVIYSDEDKLDESGQRCQPRFKPDWSPELLLAQMYLGHLCVYRRSLLEEVGGFRVGYEGSQDHDLALRITERTQRIHHIPRILYHWRMGKGSTASQQSLKPYVVASAKRALEDALARRGEVGRVEPLSNFPGHYVVHRAANPEEKISIVIPTRDQSALLERCLSTLQRHTRHPNWDLCIVDNGSREAATFELFERWHKHLGARFKVVRHDEPFNYSRLINSGAASTDGPLLLFLNNDTEVLDPGWLEELAGYARQGDVGPVGCRLLYPDHTIQHAGVLLSPRWVALHAEVGLRGDAGGYFGHLVSSTNFSAVTSACLMVRRKVFDAVGGFEERLAVAYNDVDFCLRAGEHGMRTVFLGHVRLIHHESKTRDYDLTPEKRARLRAEAEWMKQRWSHRLTRDPAQNPNVNLLTYAAVPTRPPPSR